VSGDYIGVKGFEVVCSGLEMENIIRPKMVCIPWCSELPGLIKFNPDQE